MKISFTQICREYHALRGESPDLSPLLDEDEYSPVLSIERELGARLLPAAIEATLGTPLPLLDEIRSVTLTPVRREGILCIDAPKDYLRFISLKLSDNPEPVKRPEREGLRYSLGASAPPWMITPANPMVTEHPSPESTTLRIYGSAGGPVILTYVPMPEFDGVTLTISRHAYYRLQILCLRKEN